MNNISQLYIYIFLIQGTLKHQNGNLLKPLINGDTRSVRELSFYQQVFESSNSDPVLHELKSFLPSFHGTWETTIGNSSKLLFYLNYYIP